MSCRSKSPAPSSSKTGFTYPAPGSRNALLSAIPTSLRTRPLYSYVVTTIETTSTPPHDLIQNGSAPNFEGGRITLCTCKHKDRATFYPSGNRARPWDQVWVAGLTSKSSHPSRSLAYLMLVEATFPNQNALWEHLPSACRTAKSARHSPLGDLYEPKEFASAHPHSPAYYHSPVAGHVHASATWPTGWHHDIALWTSKAYPHGLPHPLLLGEAEMSFRWPTASLRLKSGVMGATAHHKHFNTLRDFIANLI